MSRDPDAGTARPPTRAVGRGQSNVIGVALLLGVTVLALAGLTAGIGTVVQGTAATADAERVADGFERTLRPVETTGVRRGSVSFSSGQLRVVERDLRVTTASGTRRIRVDALVYEADDRRVVFQAGAVVVDEPTGSRLRRAPPITASRDRGGILVVGAPRLNASGGGVSGTGGVEAFLRTRVTHERVSLGEGRFRVAVETRTPDAWKEAFRRLNATTGIRDVDGDGVESVVGRFSGRRTAYLVVHDMHLEVGR